MKIVEVTNSRLLKKFIRFPITLYRGDENYVPQLNMMQKQMLTKGNPFFEHSSAAYFMAMDNGKVVGRIAAIVNSTHHRIYHEHIGFFGFFDCINDTRVAKLLVDSAMDWLSHKGITEMVGPTNFTTNDACGIVVDGFDQPPNVLMPYNKRYYEQLLGSLGFEKEMDLYSYQINRNFSKWGYSDDTVESLEKKLEGQGIRIRSLNFREWDTEIPLLRDIYNTSNAENWGFVPLSESEFESMATELKQLVSPELIQIAERDGKHIGFILAVPNYNQVFRHITSGRLLPFGFLKLLYYRRKIDNLRVMILGVAKEYRNRGIDYMLYHTIKKKANALGYFVAEACYVLESNKPMNQILKKMGAEIVKVYRLYRYRAMPHHYQYPNR